MTRRPGLAGVLVAVIVAALVATGCGPGLQSFSVGRGVAGGSYPITAVFNDATGLPIGGHVELHDVTVGRVESMQAHNFKAYVQLRISSSVKLPTGTRAQLALTTPLGEEYVNLLPPAGSAASAATTADLSAGASINEDATSRAPDVEDLLSAFSAVLNGGGVDQIHSILNELGKALNGRTQAGRSLISNLNTVLAQLSHHTGQIDATLGSVSRVAKQFAGQRALIVRALTKLSPGIKALSSDTAGFTRLVTRLARLGRTATSVLGQVQSTLISDLKGLGPTLDTLVLLRPGLRGALTGLQRFATLLDRAIPGDFLNLNGSIEAK
jgi:phospholipid/cholesterol/gamma-HCH transport system substrate-binding protein